MESACAPSGTAGAVFEADPGAVRRIQLDLDDAEVVVSPHAGGSILLRQTEERSGCRLQAEVIGDLLVARTISAGPFWLQHSVQIRIMLPALYCGELSVSVRSGQTAVRGLNLARIDCRQRSGRLQITGCSAAGGLEAEVHSGRMELMNVDAGDLVLRSASGDICCERVVCSTLRADSLSGRQDLGVHAAGACTLTAKSGPLHFAGSTPELKTDTKSGSQHLRADGLERADLKALSGTLELSVPEGPNLTRIDLAVVSGRADLRLPTQTMPVIDLQAVQAGCRCRSADFAPDGRPVQIQARMASGRLRVTPWAAGTA